MTTHLERMHQVDAEGAGHSRHHVALDPDGFCQPSRFENSAWMHNDQLVMAQGAQTCLLFDIFFIASTSFSSSMRIAAYTLPKPPLPTTWVREVSTRMSNQSEHETSDLSHCEMGGIDGFRIDLGRRRRHTAHPA